MLGGPGHEVESRKNIGEIHLHLEEIGTITRSAPIAFAEQQKSVLINLIGPLRIDFGLYELFLCMVELVIGVLSNGGCEIGDKDVPIEDQLKVGLRVYFVVPK